MNNVDRIVLKDNLIAAFRAKRRVRKMYLQDQDYDLGALYAYLWKYIDDVRFRAPALSGQFLSEGVFERWLTDLDKWLITVAALYNITLPEEE